MRGSISPRNRLVVPYSPSSRQRHLHEPNNGCAPLCQLPNLSILGRLPRKTNSQLAIRLDADIYLIERIGEEDALSSKDRHAGRQSAGDLHPGYQAKRERTEQ